MTRKQKLELTWIGKDKRPRLEPRILLEDPERSYHAPQRVTDDDRFDNHLIFGDNLLALKALEQEFTGQVKCVFIDPPYNTGSAFTHYDDGLEHSIWLSLMRDRLEIIRNLLAEDGSLWITIDDHEAHYLKVLCDEVFGRNNFIADISWQKAYTSNQTAKHISSTNDHILVYAKRFDLLAIGKLSRSKEQKEKFKNPDNDQRGPWKAENLSAGKFYAAGQFKIIGPTGSEFFPPKNRYWRCNESQYKEWLKDDRITFGLKGTGRPMLKKFLSEMKDELTPSTWWNHEDYGNNKEASIHLKSILASIEKVFATPKPEKLLEKAIGLSSMPGDLVLDSFAGSGTTGAVAHKMGRRWIMVELGEHCHTHIIPRLKKVIDGEDPGGITEAVNWKGGGGFRYYRLAPSLLERDRWGLWVINPAYNAAMLAEALCKLEGFRYQPSETHWWQHGRSTETDFIYVTTQNLAMAQLDVLAEEVGERRSLLVLCSAFRGVSAANAGWRWPNLTVKKIPKLILSRCEWGQDDYSLNVQNLPMAKPDPRPTTTASKGRGRPAPEEQGRLFGDEA